MRSTARLVSAFGVVALACLSLLVTNCSNGNTTKSDGGSNKPDAASGCKNDNDCPFGQTCNTTTGKCNVPNNDGGTGNPDGSGGDAGPGDGGGADAGGCSRLSCAPDKICVGGTCVAPTMCDAGGSICCNSANHNDDCPLGKWCNFGQCQAGCSQNSDCPPSAPNCDVGNHLCGKCTNSSQCPAGYVCDPVSGACKVGSSGDGGAGCNSNADCTGGLVCKNHGCVPCTSNPQCSAGQVCQIATDGGTNVCVLSTDGGGNICLAGDGGANCGGDSCCQQQGQNYYCDDTTKLCKYRCLSDSDCTSGYKCETNPASADYGKCVPNGGCNCSAVTCPANTTCDPVDCKCKPSGSCQCNPDGGLLCPAGYTCDAASCQCVSGPGPDGGNNGNGTDGTQCTSDADCASGFGCNPFDIPPVCREKCVCITKPCTNSAYQCYDWFSFCQGTIPYCAP